MRWTRGVLAAFLAAAAPAGCSDDAPREAESEPAEPTRRAASSAPAAPGPRTAAEFPALAKETTAGAQGWTFAVKGSEEPTLAGQRSAATCTATVHRTTGEPWAPHSTGTSRSKGVARSEEVYVVDGTDVTERNVGTFAGTIALPDGAA